MLPIDDLYWSEVDKKYTALSEDEVIQLIIALFGKQPYNPLPLTKYEIEQSMKLMKWANHVRTGNLLLQGVVSGRLNVMLSENGTPKFSLKERDLDE